MRVLFLQCNGKHTQTRTGGVRVSRWSSRTFSRFLSVTSSLLLLFFSFSPSLPFIFSCFLLSPHCSCFILLYHFICLSHFSPFLSPLHPWLFFLSPIFLMYFFSYSDFSRPSLLLSCPFPSSAQVFAATCSLCWLTHLSCFCQFRFSGSPRCRDTFYTLSPWGHRNKNPMKPGSSLSWVCCRAGKIIHALNAERGLNCAFINFINEAPESSACMFCLLRNVICPSLPLTPTHRGRSSARLCCESGDGKRVGSSRFEVRV